MNQTIWRYRTPSQTLEPPPCSPELIETAQGSRLLAQLLYQRGMTTPEAATAFLDMTHYTPTGGLDLPDMAEAVDRIQQAIEKNEHILVYGDFDVDGITGSSILVQALNHLNASVSYYIPDRAKEGHGLNTAALCRLVSARQVKLVITTDTGITNFNEVSLLKGLGVDTIVTDHHGLPENLPPSVANVNSMRLPEGHPLSLLSGAGMAYKLCEVLMERLGAPQAKIDALIELAAIGTVADLVPLRLENRYIVFRGLQIMQRRERPGLKALLEQAGMADDAQLTSETIGFAIGPRLNALGRLANATEAVELLTTEDTERARVLAAHLEQLNRQRKDLCEKIYLDAEKFMSATGGLDGRKAIVLASPDWHLGVIGIVASRLIEKYHVPTLMMVVDEAAGEVRCSARSIPGFDLHQNLSKVEKYFTKFGGHAGAAGFSMKLSELDAFKQAFYAVADQAVSEEAMLPLVHVDADLHMSQVNTRLVELIQTLAPFGQENPAPKFVLKDAKIGAQRGIGQDGTHLKLVLTGSNGKQTDQKPIEGIIWRHGTDKLNPSTPHQFVVVPELNTFNGNTKVQLVISDYKTTDTLIREQHKPTSVGHASKPSHSTNTPSSNPGLANGNGVTPTLPADSPENPVEAKMPNWIDHRQRENLESFVGQLMLPLQEGRSVVMYHEGRMPEIPFLDSNILMTRLDLRSAQELILWDLPPDFMVLQGMLETVNPKTVHLVGGKYQTVPVFQQAKDYLKVIFQMLRKEVNGATAPTPLEVAGFASRVAGTQAVVNQGLMLLETVGMIETSVADSQSGSLAVAVNPSPDPAKAQRMQEQLAFTMFQDGLKAVGDYRHWLLEAGVADIKARVYNGQTDPVRQPVGSL